MTKEKPLLSICIPTYNRSKYLKKSMDSIVTQDEFLNGAVEIVVSDNASTDDTRKVVESYLKKYENVHYFRNEENIRDRNFPTVLGKAQGKLRRLCNDTLVFRPNSLKTMCSVVNEFKNSQPFVFWANGSAKSKQEIENVHFNEFVEKVSYWMTSIACFSIWDIESEKVSTDFDGCQLLLWQVKKGLEISSKKDNILIVNTKLTDSQIVEKKNMSYGLFQVFYKNYFSILEPYFESGKLNGKEKKYLEKHLLFGYFTNLVALWELKYSRLEYSKTEDLKKAVWNAYRNKPYWFRFLLWYHLKLNYLRIKQQLKKLLVRE